MTTPTTDSCWSLVHLPSATLLTRLDDLVARDRRTTAELLAHLAEVDARRLYLEAACSSLFGYCVERLHYSEPAAYKRVRAARAARDFPVIFDLVARGDLHLAAVTLVAPHLTAGNHEELLAAAVHRSKRAIEELVAARFPVADVPDRVRAVTPARAAARGDSAPAQREWLPLPRAPQPAATATPPPSVAERGLPPVVAPLAADRFRVQFTATRDVRDRLREAQDLLRREVPDGDLNAVIGQALAVLVRELRRKRFAAAARPRSSVAEVDGTRHSAHVPAAVRRAVAERDGYQCTFVDAAGRRCPERALLELHHCDPQGRGGVHSVDTLTSRCRGHHALATARQYGAEHVARAITVRRARQSLAPGPPLGLDAGARPPLVAQPARGGDSQQP